VLVLIIHGLMLAPLPFALRAVVGFIWAGLVPGALTMRLLTSDDPKLGALERALLAVGLGYVNLVLGTLLLHFLPGPLTRGHIIVANDLLLLSLLVLDSRKRAFARDTRWSWFSSWLPVRFCALGQASGPSVQANHQPWSLQRLWNAAGGLGAILLLAFLFRVPNLGYSEFQGDEAKVLVKAAAVIQGEQGALFLHNKGPAEILVTTFVYAMAGRVTEGLARAPFTLANLGGVIALLMVGRRYFGRRTGWWAAVLISLNGYFVAFARIVQYQSLVFFMGCLIMLCIHWLWEGGRPRSVLILGALFTAAGLLAHYDMVFVLPSVGYLLLTRWLAHPDERRGILRWTMAAAFILLIALGLFYVPYVQHPHLATTVDYLSRRIGGYPPYANFGHFLLSSTAYNSIYYVGLMVMLLTGVAFWRLSRVTREGHLLAWAPILLFGAGIASQVIWPEWWSLEPAPRSWSGVLFACMLLVLLVTKANDVLWKAVLLWFAVPFVLYTFLIGDARTHLYVMFPGWALLGSQGLVHIQRHLGQGTMRWLAQGLLAALLSLSGLYLYWMFVQHMVEVKRTYPLGRLPIYWTPYGDRFPKVGLFGFPYRAGWKAIGTLYANGTLKGDYSSNEETQITLWYTRGALRCEGEPRYYLIAEEVQDRRPVPMQKVVDDYELVGAVQVGRRPRIHIYEAKPGGLDYAEYRLEEIDTHFDNSLSGPHFDTDLEGRSLTIQQPASLWLGDDIEFLGYDLKTNTSVAGDPVCLTLYWRAVSPIAQDYKVFVHLEGGGHLAAQKDGQPGCWQHPTTSWIPGDVIADPYCLLTKPGIPAGDYSLRAGLYLLETGQRLDVFDDVGTALGNAIELGRVEVVEGR
jgi:4-amino-4-deoxy-L-arabinose transferase-like glycosyltransferase